MRLLSWNVLAGGGSRCGPIVETLRRYDADIIALQETVTARAAISATCWAGTGTRSAPAPPARAQGPRALRSVARSRRPPRHRAGAASGRHLPRGWLGLDLPESGVRLAAVYGPAAGPALPAFWNATAAWLAGRAARPHRSSCWAISTPVPRALKSPTDEAWRARPASPQRWRSRTPGRRAPAPSRPRRAALRTSLDQPRG